MSCVSPPTLSSPSLSPPTLPPSWTALCRVHRHHVRLEVRLPNGQRLMQARLPVPPTHPRVVFELLEVLARLGRCGLTAAISADSRSQAYFDNVSWDQDHQWDPSALVHVIDAARSGPAPRLGADPRRTR